MKVRDLCAKVKGMRDELLVCYLKDDMEAYKKQNAVLEEYLNKDVELD